MRSTITPALALGVLGAASSAQILFEDATLDADLGSYHATTGDWHAPGGVFTDLDNDGWPDLYLTHNGPNRLYRNVPAPGGGRAFELLTGTGAEQDGPATGAIAGDYDNDGDLDLFVLNYNQADRLLQSQLAQTGQLTFTDATIATDPSADPDQWGLRWGTFDGVFLDNSLSAAWGDPDRDGDLDLYVAHHNGFFNNPEEGPFWPLPGRRDVFYLNNADGTFTDVSMTLGVIGYESEGGEAQTDFQRFSSSNAVIFADLDNDRWPDLFVTNKIGGPTDRDMLYVNRGDDAEGNWLGFEVATYAMTPTFGHQSGAAMGVDVGDYDMDGDLDLYITDYSDLANPDEPGHNDLWTNQLQETGTLGFVHSLDMPAAFSWGAHFQDFDNDALVDMHVTTQEGFTDFVYHNAGAGLMQDISAGAGAAQGRNSRGSMSADFDRDGWIDVIAINIDGGDSALLRNLSGTLTPDHAWLSLKLVGDPTLPGDWRSSRDAIGARVQVTADLDGDGAIGPGELQIREVVSGNSSAASTSSLELEFGLRDALGARVRVLWPSGRVSLYNVGAGAHLTLTEGAAPCSADFAPPIGSLSFSDVLAFVTLFGGADPAADIAPPYGLLDFSDVLAFLASFGAGCP